MAPAFRCGFCGTETDRAEESETHVAGHVKSQRVMEVVDAQKHRRGAPGRVRGVARARAEREAKGSAANEKLRARALDLRKRTEMSDRAIAKHLRISRGRLARLLAPKRRETGAAQKVAPS